MILIVSRAGIGIAMGNSVEELKAAADYVTESIDRNRYAILPGILNGDERRR